MRRLLFSMVGAVLLSLSAAVNAAPAILPNAIYDFSLAALPQSNVAWDPVQQKYYAAQTGNPGMPGYVFGPAGQMLQNYSPMGIDMRGVIYNPNSGAVEVTAYYPGNVFRLGRDANGLFTGTNTAIANYPDYSLSTYDPARDRLYSLVSANTVSVRDYPTGTSLSPITLDLAAAGDPNIVLTSYCIGYDPTRDVLIATEPATKRALVFDIAGGYLGASQLPASATVYWGYFMGYANDRLFSYGSAYQIFVPEPSALSLLVFGALPLLRRKRDRAARQ